jgi:hypothetical protein
MRRSGIVQHDRVAVGRRDLGDAAAHSAGADHTDFRVAIHYAHLLAGEGRLTLREERADALDKIAGAPSLALEVCLEIELGIEIVGQ